VTLELRRQYLRTQDSVLRTQNSAMLGGFVSRMYALEKFSHLEDKIYRTIDQFKRERRDREALEAEIQQLRSDLATASSEKQQLERQIQRLLNERDSIKLKVESMLSAVNKLDLESEAAG